MNLLSNKVSVVALAFCFFAAVGYKKNPQQPTNGNQSACCMIIDCQPLLAGNRCRAAASSLFMKAWAEALDQTITFVIIYIKY